MPEDHRGPVGETHRGPYSNPLFQPAFPPEGPAGGATHTSFGFAYRGFLAEARRGMRVMPFGKYWKFLSSCDSKRPTEGPKS